MKNLAVIVLVLAVLLGVMLREVPCEKCGESVVTKVSCEKCSGSGKTSWRLTSKEGVKSLGAERDKSKCLHCKGMGYFERLTSIGGDCPSCEGKGKIKFYRTFQE